MGSSREEGRRYYGGQKVGETFWKPPWYQFDRDLTFRTLTLTERLKEKLHIVEFN